MTCPRPYRTGELFYQAVKGPCSFEVTSKAHLLFKRPFKALHHLETKGETPQDDIPRSAQLICQLISNSSQPHVNRSPAPLQASNDLVTSGHQQPLFTLTGKCFNHCICDTCFSTQHCKFSKGGHCSIYLCIPRSSNYRPASLIATCGMMLSELLSTRLRTVEGRSSLAHMHGHLDTL